MQIPYFKEYLGKHQFSARIEEAPASDLAISVVIPCFNEPDLLTSLRSLLNCDRPVCAVEVIVVVNYPEGSDDTIVAFHEETLQKARLWISGHSEPKLRFHLIDAPALPQKFAGVGFARKIGMDEAVSRYSVVGNERGIICGFDADAKVDPNYFTVIEEHFRFHSKTPGASVYFEHPLDIENSRFLSGIVQYETHLRYLLQANRHTGFPYAFHTVGSSFAVTANAYVKQGGMNRFKAGEDFYFLNKIIQLGNFTEINATRVIPAPRVSNRVPFGTGASMTRWMESDEDDFRTYQFSSFLPLKQLFSEIDIVYQTQCLSVDIRNNSCLGKFMQENEFDAALVQFFQNSNSLPTFRKRFFAWFDAFRIVKYLNYAASADYPKQPVIKESDLLLKAAGYELNILRTGEMLKVFRNWDRTGNPGINLLQ